ncbi:phage tail sheath family protein [Lacinutrix sp. MEBiC02404]
MAAKYKTPGVYIEELNGVPNSVVPVATAIPAFVGYTPQAIFEGESHINVPIKISSFADFQAIFCFPDTDSKKQYNPHYYLIKQARNPERGSFMQIGNDFYAVVPDPNTIYYMYNSIQLFYQNGGGDAYIVSVGSYGEPSNDPLRPGDVLVNPNVQLDDLQNGIALLKNETEPTMYICPEATLLSVVNNGALMQSMLFQNSEMRTAISIFDVIGGTNPDPILYTDDIDNFRNNTGARGLSFGCAYYPFIGTVIMQEDDLDFTNLFGGNLDALEALLNPSEKPNKDVAEIFKKIKCLDDAKYTLSEFHKALLNGSTLYTSIIQKVLLDVNVLPPSGAMAGVITKTDNQEGVWKAPANTSIVGAVSLPIRLTSQEQEGLNVDAISGKSINAIRLFPGIGILIWGARTLDGNSRESRYISVRRTLIFIEQSCGATIQSFAFERNERNTWDAVNNSVSSFLYSIWKKGGLQGSMPDNSFFVRCGLGETMTADDILESNMIVEIGVAVVRPSEFIVIRMSQEITSQT